MTDLLARMSRHSDTASWAVWGPEPTPRREFTRTSDLSFPDEETAGPVVHGDVVLVALNPGRPAAGHRRTPWHTFHAGARHRDHSLAEACRGTRLWGGYMTDVHADIVDSDSTKVTTERSAVRAAVDRLAAQIHELGSSDPVIIALGHSRRDPSSPRTTYGRLLANMDLLESAGVRPERLVGVIHYSPTAVSHYGDLPGERAEQRYREHVHRRLHDAGLSYLVEVDADADVAL